MTFFELFIIAVGLSMDAFAVSICKGLSIGKASLRQCGTVGLYFGGFQAAMPFIGFLLGTRFANYIVAYDHWIAFVLLAVIGGKMLKEGFEKNDASQMKADENSLSPGKMLPLAVATSIDALAVGVSFAFLQVDIVPAITLIGITTLLLSAIGTRIGSLVGLRFKSWAEKAGGFILICMGIKILLEHLEILML